MIGPDSIQEVGLKAREIAVLVDGVIPGVRPADALVLARVADLAQDIEAKTRSACGFGDRQALHFAKWIGMISGILYMLSLLQK